MPSETRACQQEVVRLTRSWQVSLCVRPDTRRPSCSPLRGFWGVFRDGTAILRPDVEI